MANYNIGPKIGIEGEAQFRSQIRRINQEYKAMADYTKSVTTSMDQQGKSQEKLAAKANSLRQQIGLQEQKYEELSKALAKANEMYDDNSQEVLRFKGALLDVENVVSDLRRELDGTETELQRMADGLDDVGDAAGDSETKVFGFGDALKANLASGAIQNTLENAAELIVDVGKAAVEAAAGVKAENAQFSQTFRELEDSARKALEGIADDTGIAVSRLQDGYTSLYAFTKSVGGDSAAALNIAQRALSAAADSAAYYDRSVEDATETLQSFLKGNYENDAALGIAATETTRNAKANELYAKSFKELTEAQKVDTLLAMVEAGNAASGALGQAAREADSWANVTGELAEAWRQMLAVVGGPVLQGLTPIIQGITGAINELVAVRDWETLNTSVAAFEQSLTDSAAALADTQSEMDANASIAKRYVSRLRELEGAGLTTAETQREYAQTVELLNALMPELGLTINAATGRLEQNTWAIEANVDALAEQARQQAEQAYYADIIADLTAVEKARYAAEVRLHELQAKEQELIAQGAVVYDTYTAAQLGSAGAAAEMSAAMTEQDRALMEVQAEMAATQGAIDNANTSIAAHRETLDAAKASADGMTQSTSNLAGATAEVPDAVQTLRQAYEDAKTAARESIDSQIGLFEELETKSDKSAQDIIKNWESQRKAFADYSDNLQKAIDLGLDETLVQQLSDGSNESMLILAELVSGTDADIDKINESFRGLSEARDTASEAMADVRKAFDDEFQAMIEAANSGGYDTGTGVAAGIRNSIPEAERAMAQLAKKAQAAYNRTMEINSPSRVMMESGEYSGEGAAKGVLNMIPDMERAMADLARAGNTAYLQEQLDYAAAYPSMIAGAAGYGATSNNTTNHVAYGGITINVSTQPGQDPRAFADAVLDVLTAELEQKEAGLG